ncbi:hypothetical protein [Parendozoicomonas sp. Alg238-R29]|nr:hypothetical protein [Parendozoicomonas sp. Alg238-R29]
MSATAPYSRKKFILFLITLSVAGLVLFTQCMPSEMASHETTCTVEY